VNPCGAQRCGRHWRAGGGREMRGARGGKWGGACLGEGKYEGRGGDVQGVTWERVGVKVFFFGYHGFWQWHGFFLPLTLLMHIPY
jgi:hypothetical protein